MCPGICSFCRNSASKLITHHLCQCCSERFLKYDETATGSVDGGCLKQKHELLDESKDEDCQRTSDTLSLHKCILCNDRQTYPESFYWKHVHEEHDGFFLRCSDCGENFRSQKLKTNHEKNHCKARAQVAPLKCVDLQAIKVEPIDNGEGQADPAATATSCQTLVGPNFGQYPSTTTRCSTCQKECFNVAFLEEHIEQTHPEVGAKKVVCQKLTECKTSNVSNHEPFESVFLQQPGSVKIKDEISTNQVSIDKWSNFTLVEVNQCHSTDAPTQEAPQERTIKVEEMDVEPNDSDGFPVEGATGQEAENHPSTSTNQESRSEPEFQITVPARDIKKHMQNLEHGFRIRTRKQKTFGNYESYYCNRVRPKCKQQCERRAVVIINDSKATVTLRGSHTCHLLSADSLSRHALVSHKNPPQSGESPLEDLEFREKLDPSNLTSPPDAKMNFNPTDELETDRYQSNNAYEEYYGEGTTVPVETMSPNYGASAISPDGYQFHKSIPVEQLSSYLESYEFGYTFRLRRKNSRGQNKYYICRSIKYRVRPQCERKLRVFTPHEDAQDAIISIRGNHTCLTAPIAHLSRQTLQRLYSSEKAASLKGSGATESPVPSSSCGTVENCSVKEEVLPS